MFSLYSRALKSGLLVLFSAASVALAACAPKDGPVVERRIEAPVLATSGSSARSTEPPGARDSVPVFTRADCPLPLDGIECGSLDVGGSPTVSSVYVAFALDPIAYASPAVRTTAVGRIDARLAALQASVTELASPEEPLGVLGIELEIAALNEERVAVLHAAPTS